MRVLPALVLAVLFMPCLHAQQLATALEYRLYPNPAHDKVVLEIPEASVVMLEIYNLQGQLVLGGPVLRGSNTISVGNLPAGVYVFRMQGKDGEIATERLLKE